jgi:hypothetical protein
MVAMANKIKASFKEFSRHTCLKAGLMHCCLI